MPRLLVFQFALFAVATIACSSSGTGGHADAAAQREASAVDTSRPGRDASADAGVLCAAPSCDLVSASEANAALGTAVMNPTSKSQMTGDSTLTTCTFATTESDASPAGDVTIQYASPETMASFIAAEGADSGATVLPNLGDAAYLSSSSGVGTLVVLVGCVSLRITATASSNQLLQLAGDIVPELRATM